MMALIFLLLLLSVILAWAGVRKPALACFVITFVLAVIWFLHHVTSSLAIQL